MYKNIEELRSQFPELARTFYGKPLVYLDNAATSQRPQSVVDCLMDMTQKYNANIHRSSYALAEEASAIWDKTRDYVASYMGAASKDEIVFTSGDTASINIVAYSFGERFISEGDEIIVSEQEHHSNIVPWQMLAQRKGAIIKVWKVREDYSLNKEDLNSLISPSTKLVCVTHASNILGVINPVKDICSIAHSYGVPVLVDGAQGIVHSKVDVQDMDCDFYTFSGHKIYAATGTGVLYAKYKWLEEMPPFLGGGDMIDVVSFEGTTYAKAPQKFEAGTQNIAAIPTLVPALEMAESMRQFEKKSEAVKEYVYNRLCSDPEIELYGKTDDLSLKIPVFSFAVKGAHHGDMAVLLDKLGIAVRSGQMCAAPLLGVCGVTGVLRASFAPYNTMEEAEYFFKSLERVVTMLK